MAWYRDSFTFLSEHLPGQTKKKHEKSVLTVVVGFEVLTVVDMESSRFWDIKPCSPLKINTILEEYVAPIFRVEE
jgi:hypothetical protein